ncbi:MAG: DUF3248 domain-containing protein [Anaerolineales bacterium]|nr:DUF3248 domain-containing protein [Anaerolineales bacterium]
MNRAAHLVWRVGAANSRQNVVARLC